MSRELRLESGHTLSDEELEAFGAELDAIRHRIVASRGASEATYMRRLIRIQRGLGILGRAFLFAGHLPPFFVLGTALLALSKILENMEIGHNILHGQYEFTRDPALDGKHYEWDMVGPSSGWRVVHNQVHHTNTNIVGLDRDVGYGMMRISELQPWHPRFLVQPFMNVLLATFFEWGISFHNVQTKPYFRGEKSLETLLSEFVPIAKKTSRQLLKDYVFPLLAGPNALVVFAGNFTANIIRNLWAYVVIFCGHFPEGVATFSIDETRNESRGRFYLRQMLGSANLEGGPLFHVMTGNLSHQIEHHLFPDLPSCRYAEIAIEVRAIAARYGIPYHTGSLARQFGSVALRICKLALPPRAARSTANAAA